MHSGVVIDIFYLYIVILKQSLSDLDVMQGHKGGRKKKLLMFYASYLAKLSVDLNGIWYAIIIC